MIKFTLYISIVTAGIMACSTKGSQKAEASSTQNVVESNLTANQASLADGANASSAAPDHAAFDKLLAAYISSTGVVNYKALKADEKKLDEYLALLAKSTPGKGWSSNDGLAYWLNAYNAFTLKLILKNYPVKSIQDINKGKPWDLNFITLAGKSYTLNDIENKVIRPVYKDARIHFAINCAAISCPPLAAKAFTGDNVNSLLESRTKTFINSSANSITKNAVKVSKIFDWYKEDFGNLVTYLNKYSKQTIAANATVAYTEYNWNLNGK